MNGGNLELYLSNQKNSVQSGPSVSCKKNLEGLLVGVQVFFTRLNPNPIKCRAAKLKIAGERNQERQFVERSAREIFPYLSDLPASMLDMKWEFETRDSPNKATRERHL